MAVWWGRRVGRPLGLSVGGQPSLSGLLDHLPCFSPVFDACVLAFSVRSSTAVCLQTVVLTRAEGKFFLALTLIKSVVSSKPFTTSIIFVIVHKCT